MTVILIAKDAAAEERRVAAVPETVGKLVAAGHEVTLVPGAGLGASFGDDVFAAAGAKVAASAAKGLAGADIVLAVGPPSAADINSLKTGAIVIGLLDPHRQGAVLKALADKGVTAFAMELVPRTTRAQVMDALSSQANLAGYRAVIEAAASYGKVFPLMTTAAGTVKPAKVFVMGAGVAGLQAIATARRLGAVVTATDVRPAAKEQVESLGAKFVAVEDDEFKAAETAGGYAKAMSAEYQAKQAELVSAHIRGQDVVITTALIPGRPAPRLVSAAQVASMQPGSVIVDLAVEQGGNVEGVKAGEVSDVGGVKVVGFTNLASRVAAEASSLYARNLLAFTKLLFDKDGALAPDFEDDILKAACVVRDGQILIQG